MVASPGLPGAVWRGAGRARPSPYQDLSLSKLCWTGPYSVTVIVKVMLLIWVLLLLRASIVIV